jgi:hypothetical protein
MMNLFKFQKSNETKGICKTEYIGWKLIPSIS